MSQRSFSNERYRKNAKIGSTRKSASSAKPIRKQGSAESSAKSSSAKSSKSSAKPKQPKDGIERDWSGMPTSPQIKKWRLAWWVLLLSGLAVIGISYLVPEFRNNEGAARIASFVVLTLSMVAISIDLVIIRKLRKELIAAVEAKSAKKPSKGETKKSDANTGETNKGEKKKSGKDAS